MTLECSHSHSSSHTGQDTSGLAALERFPACRKTLISAYSFWYYAPLEMLFVCVHGNCLAVAPFERVPNFIGPRGPISVIKAASAALKSHLHFWLHQYVCKTLCSKYDDSSSPPTILFQSLFSCSLHWAEVTQLKTYIWKSLIFVCVCVGRTDIHQFKIPDNMLTDILSHLFLDHPTPAHVHC